jgi:hypothetical protein
VKKDNFSRATVPASYVIALLHMEGEVIMDTITFTVEITIILALVGFTVGLVVGVLLVRPRFS